jgi:hypothetical protein
MINEKLVLTIAEAILANTRVLQSLVDTLPKATQVAIADQVVKATPVTPAAQVVAPVPVAPVVAAPAPIPTPTPVAPVIAPVASIPVPPPVVTAPVVAPPVPSGVVPFVDQKGMIKYVMDTYKALGASRGADIQAVLTGIGTSNINEVKPEHYAALFAGIEALK